jgi:hypothetical protein
LKKVWRERHFVDIFIGMCGAVRSRTSLQLITIFLNLCKRSDSYLKHSYSWWTIYVPLTLRGKLSRIEKGEEKVILRERCFL